MSDIKPQVGKYYRIVDKNIKSVSFFTPTEIISDNGRDIKFKGRSITYWKDGRFYSNAKYTKTIIEIPNELFDTAFSNLTDLEIKLFMECL